MAGNGLAYEILGAVKVKDGLFIGDELAAQDLEFVVSNKVTRIVNCCGRQVPNHWESIGVVYLTYFWVDADNQVILDQRDVVANEIFRFVEGALEGAESVLIHSVRGQSRSCCVLTSYMIQKHSWGLRKTLEFLSFRRPDMNLKPGFLQQLSGYERRLMSQADRPFSLDWNDADFSSLESEELLLRNTYINSQMGPLAEFHANDATASAKPRRLVWRDGDRDDKSKLEKPAGADRLQGPPQGVLKKTLRVPTAGGHAATLPGGACLGAAAGERQPCAAGPPGGALAPSWPGTVENPEIQHPPPAKGGLLAGVVPGVSGPYGHIGPATVLTGPPEVVSGAWAADGDPSLGNTTMTDGSGPYGVDGPQSSRSQPFQRGPATNIRDSLQQQRRDGLDSSRANGGGGSRPPSRDPSPKTGPGGRPRGESPSQRGKPPVRYFSPAGSRAATPPVASGAYPAAAPTGRQAAAAVAGGYPVYPGLSLSGVRASSAPGAPGGMTAFRSGGPVRAKADLLGGAAEGTSAPRRGRPVAAAAAARTSSGSRPASPLGATQRSGSQSRPASPSVPRPAPPAQQPPALSRTAPVPVPVQAMSYPHAQTHRSLSGHMRRAPSPTPAFNRNTSPGKPRWRA